MRHTITADGHEVIITDDHVVMQDGQLIDAKYTEVAATHDPKTCGPKKQITGIMDGDEVWITAWVDRGRNVIVTALGYCGALGAIESTPKPAKV